MRKCEGKQAFPTRREAELVATRTSGRGYGPMHAYNCRECFSFHIGHKRNLNKKLKTKDRRR